MTKEVMMASNDYQFVTRWRVKSTVEEISDILGNAPDLMRWWPSVYLDVQQVEPGDEKGIGKVVRLYTKGWLPYTLNWQFRIIRVNYPYGSTLEAWGDFVGRGVWTFAPDGEWVNITYEWTVRADKPLLEKLSFLMKPLFAANHYWAMRMGEKSLALELDRRHATTSAARALVPAPPPPASPTLFYGLAAAILILPLLLWLSRRLARSYDMGAEEHE